MNSMHTLAAGLGWNVWLMGISFAVVCVFMMLVILIQKPKGGGLSGAFGGGAGGGSAGAVVGARVGDVLTIVTVVCFLLFLGLAMGLTWSTSPIAETDDDADPATQVENGAGAAGTPVSDPTPESEAPDDEAPNSEVPDSDTPDHNTPDEPGTPPTE